MADGYSDDLSLAVELEAPLERFEQNMRRAAGLVDTTAEALDKSTKRAAQDWNRQTGYIDGNVSALRRYENAVEVAREAQRKKVVTDEQAAARIRQLNQAYEQGAFRTARWGKAIQEASAEAARANAQVGRFNASMGSGARGSKAFGSNMQNLAFQFGDFFTQVASGQGVLRPLIQQGTQAVSIFGPFGAVVGAAGAAVGALAASMLDGEDTADAYAEAIDALAGRQRDLTEAIWDGVEASAAQLQAGERQARFDEALARTNMLEARNKVNAVRQQIAETEERLRRPYGDSEREKAAVEALREREAEWDIQVDILEKYVAARADANRREKEEAEDADKAGEAKRKLAEAAGDAVAALEAESRVLAVRISQGDEAADMLALELSQRAALGEAYDSSADKLNRLNETIARQKNELADMREAEREAEKALKRYNDEVAKTAKDIGSDVSDYLVRGLTEGFENGLDDLGDVFKRWLLRLGATALENRIIVPITQEIVGGAPGLFGISGPSAGGAGGGVSGGGLFDFLSDGSLTRAPAGVSKLISSDFGQSIGLSEAVASGGWGSASGAAAGGWGSSGAINSGWGTAAPAVQNTAFGNALENYASPLGILGNIGGGLLADALFSGGRSAAQNTNASIGQQVGAAAGSFIPIPGVGTAIGAIAGNFLGGMFGPGESVGPISGATATLSGGAASLTKSGSDNGGDIGRSTALLNSLAGAVQALGTAAGGAVGKQEAAVEVIEKTGEITVAAAGQTATFNSEAEAMLFGVKALAGDIMGLDQEMEAAVESASSLEEAMAAVADMRAASALKDERIRFQREMDLLLRDFTDPAGVAVERANDGFSAMLAEASRVGARLEDVERLYGAKRLAVVQAFSEAQLSALVSGGVLDAALASFERTRRGLVAEISGLSTGFDEALSGFEAFRESLQAFKDDLALDRDLSVLDPAEQYAEAGAIFDRVLSQARAGDAAAIGRLQDAGRAFLEQSISFNAATSAYGKDYARVIGALDDFSVNGGAGITVAEQQLTVLEQIRDLLAVPDPDITSLSNAYRDAGLDPAVLEGLRDARENVSAASEAQNIDALATAYSESLQAGRQGNRSGASSWLGVARRLHEYGAVDVEGARKDYRDLLDRFPGLDPLGFSTGGLIRIPNSFAGLDSQFVGIKAMPNETISVTRPGQSIIDVAPVVQATQAAARHLAERLAAIQGQLAQLQGATAEMATQIDMDRQQRRIAGR